MNWQWVAGTGTDSRFNRIYDVDRAGQAARPARRLRPALRARAGRDHGAAVHEPWKLPDDVRAALDYPDPIIDVREGNERFLRARGKR